LVERVEVKLIRCQERCAEHGLVCSRPTPHKRQTIISEDGESSVRLYEDEHSHDAGNGAKRHIWRADGRDLFSPGTARAQELPKPVSPLEREELKRRREDVLEAIKKRNRRGKHVRSVTR